jgi:hypothetical protein
MTKSEKENRRLREKLNLYEKALLHISGQSCEHDEMKGVGVANAPRCPQCVAYCAIYPDKTMELVEAAQKVKEVEKVVRDLRGDKRWPI